MNRIIRTQIHVYLPSKLNEILTFGNLEHVKNVSKHVYF